MRRMEVEGRARLHLGRQLLDQPQPFRMNDGGVQKEPSEYHSFIIGGDLSLTIRSDVNYDVDCHRGNVRGGEATTG